MPTEHSVDCCVPSFFFPSLSSCFLLITTHHSIPAPAPPTMAAPAQKPKALRTYRRDGEECDSGREKKRKHDFSDLEKVGRSTRHATTTQSSPSGGVVDIGCGLVVDAHDSKRSPRCARRRPHRPTVPGIFPRNLALSRSSFRSHPHPRTLLRDAPPAPINMC